MQKLVRLKREIELLKNRPPPGISCAPKADKLNCLEASVTGLEGCPFEGGVFKLEIQVPDRYPFEPPQIQFKTPVYHPNVDVAGRICLDLLKLPPKGSWKPVATIGGLLSAVQLLLMTPNPDDPLMAEIAEEYRYNRPEYERKAREWTEKYACANYCLGSKKPDKSDESSVETKGKKRKSDDPVDSESEMKHKRT